MRAPGKTILFLFLLFSALPVSAKEDINFSHLGVNEGLSQNTVFNITQDKNGFMWFATYNGLSKYDGYDFHIYQHTDSNDQSIASSIIRTVKTDQLGRVWVGTLSGLSLYDPETNGFRNYHRNENENGIINHIVDIDENRLLLGGRGGVVLFDIPSESFITDGLSHSLFELNARVIYRYHDFIYIGTADGLFVYSIAQNTLRALSKNALGLQLVQSLFQQSADKLWIGTEGHGLYVLNPLTGDVKSYRKGQRGLNTDHIRSLAVDSEHRLWVGGMDALYIYNESDDRFDAYSNDPLTPNSLSHGSVRSIYKDTQGGMWLGTYFGGLNYYHPLKERFKNIRNIPFRNSLSDNTIGCIVEDHRKNLWIGTNSGGLNYYQPDTQTFIHFTPKDGLLSNDVKAVYIDEEKQLVYIGTHAGGLNILHLSGHRMETPGDIKANESVYTIVPAKEGIWLGSQDGLVLFNPSNKSFTPIDRDADGKPIPLTSVRHILRDSKDRLWVGYENGLRIFKETENGIVSHSVANAGTLLEEQDINSIYESYNKTIWVATRNGIYQIDEKKQELKHYDTSHGLSDNVVYGVLEDVFGRLWMSTDTGLSCLHPQTGIFKNYLPEDGLQSKQFTPYAFCRRENGEMYFGGINGITVFHPEHLPENPFTPSVVLTGLTLFDKVVLPDDKTGILKKHISSTEQITLKADQAMFVLSFVAPDYLSETHSLFAYQLENYDKEWIYRRNPYRTASYSSLPAGDYTFRIKASNRDGRWSEPTILNITILPYWYNTWWARLSFFTLFLVLSVSVFRLFWMRKSIQTQLEFERRDKERQHELNEMKMRFFINMSHELRTPLTLILAPVKAILDTTTDKWIVRQMEYVKRNTDRLLHIINQLMDYRRAELGVFDLRTTPTAVHRLVEKIFLNYEQIALQKGIQYEYKSELAGKEVWCDGNYIELIINNLLSNAFKHTPAGQSITIKLLADEDNLEIRVQDTGAGIPLEEQPKVFERFYQVDKEHTGSGIGLSLVKRLVELHHGQIKLDSTEGVGSTFTIYLPAKEEAYPAKERIENASTEVLVSDIYSEGYRLDLEDTTPDTVSDKENKKETVLLVEDNIDISRYLEQELEGLFNILKANNGEEALKIVKEQPVDLICTDVMMPIMSGVELCKLIKQNLRTCHIPVIILSAKSDLKDQMEGLQVGADDYIPKPFAISVVVTKIRNILRTHYLSRENYAKAIEIEPERVALNALDQELLKRAIAVVEKHMDEVEFSTESFAFELNMSRSNLHLKIKALTGEGASDFIRKIRLGYACKLLKTGQYTIAEISVMSGFNTPSYFSTSFKKYFDCLPSEYAKNSE